MQGSLNFTKQGTAWADLRCDVQSILGSLFSSVIFLGFVNFQCVPCGCSVSSVVALRPTCLFCIKNDVKLLHRSIWVDEHQCSTCSIPDYERLICWQTHCPLCRLIIPTFLMQRPVMTRERASHLYAVFPWVQAMEDVEIPWIIVQVCVHALQVAVQWSAKGPMRMLRSCAGAHLFLDLQLTPTTSICPRGLYCYDALLE